MMLTMSIVTAVLASWCNASMTSLISKEDLIRYGNQVPALYRIVERVHPTGDLDCLGNMALHTCAC